ncbi:MAG: hypothetical protein ABIU63_17105 [Chitinophagaceae bacterium]
MKGFFNNPKMVRGIVGLEFFAVIGRACTTLHTSIGAGAKISGTLLLYLISLYIYRTFATR